jgi:3-deoxy-7-phosphoheptulonate synthase
MPGVLEVIPVTHAYKLVSREVKPENSVVKVGDVAVGGGAFVIAAGPCAVESLDQMLTVARQVKAAGARLLRGGAFKPRTSPYSFQGLGEEGLKILARAREETGLPVVTEAIDAESVELVAHYADAIQIGARNMQNFALLKRAGRAKKPVLLKRGLAATLEEFLMSAEYILAEGNYDVILCERGVRTFSDFSRNTLDLAVVPAVKQISHLPILVDPSHGTGRRDKVVPMSRGSAAVGADGLIVEVHHDPDTALSDGPQSITPDAFGALVGELREITRVLGRTL